MSKKTNYISGYVVANGCPDNIIYQDARLHLGRVLVENTEEDAKIFGKVSEIAMSSRLFIPHPTIIHGEIDGDVGNFDRKENIYKCLRQSHKIRRPATISQAINSHQYIWVSFPKKDYNKDLWKPLHPYQDKPMCLSLADEESQILVGVGLMALCFLFVCCYSLFANPNLEGLLVLPILICSCLLFYSGANLINPVYNSWFLKKNKESIDYYQLKRFPNAL
jgi:hypothetical protein